MWQMQFNIDKCFILRVGRPKHKLVHLYTLHNQNLSETDSAKYLGLTITSDLQWNQHINNITNKANSILGLLRRNLRIPSQTIKTHAYQSLVRPHLEYASTVWDPHTQKNIHKLDMVQRRAARYTCNRYHNISSVTEMVGHLGWEPLATRRRNMRLCMMYKIAHTVVGDPWTEWLTASKRVTRGFHAWKYIPIYSHHNIYKFSFLPRTIIDWNSLSPHSVDSCDTVKYLGHFICNTMRDDTDILRQRRQLYARANVLARKFYMCTDEVKITLFRTFCCNLYTCQLWWNFTQAAMRKINVAYNNAFRMIMQLPRYCSASNMFAMCNVPSCQAVMRNLVYRFTIRVDRSENKLLCAIGNSDMRYQSRIKKHWMSSLYVHFRA